MAGEAGYPWTVMQKTLSQDEGGSNAPGPWIVAWCYGLRFPILVLSERLLGRLSEPSQETKDKVPIGVYMSAQQELPFMFKQWNSAVRIKDDLLRRTKQDVRWTPEFEAKVLTLEELDRWKIESELRRIASESGNGASA